KGTCDGRNTAAQMLDARRDRGDGPALPASIRCRGLDLSKACVPSHSGWLRPRLASREFTEPGYVQHPSRRLRRVAERRMGGWRRRRVLSGAALGWTELGHDYVTP